MSSKSFFVITRQKKMALTALQRSWTNKTSETERALHERDEEVRRLHLPRSPQISPDLSPSPPLSPHVSSELLARD